jgi:carbonic anhydrase
MERRQLVKLSLFGGVAMALGVSNRTLQRAIASEGGVSWGYVGANGPETWGELSSTYSACRVGTEQSPIDLQGAISADLPAIEVHYEPVPLNIFNNGHTIQVNVAPGNYLRFAEQEFELLQFHFHHPSEHTLAGQPFPMEMHLVHQNARRELAVLGVFLKEGTENPELRLIWDAMPRQKTEPETIAGVTIDVAKLLPGDRTLFEYFGSLTTPPCSETVTWMVFQEPVEVSPSQVTLFKNIFPLNARPVQPLSRRFLLLSR